MNKVQYVIYNVLYLTNGNQIKDMQIKIESDYSKKTLAKLFNIILDLQRKKDLLQVTSIDIIDYGTDTIEEV